MGGFGDTCIDEGIRGGWLGCAKHHAKFTPSRRLIPPLPAECIVPASLRAQQFKREVAEWKLPAEECREPGRAAGFLTWLERDARRAQNRDRCRGRGGVSGPDQFAARTCATRSRGPSTVRHGRDRSAGILSTASAQSREFQRILTPFM